MGDLVPNLWDQLDFSSPKSNYDMMQEFNSQLKRQVTSRKVQFLFFFVAQSLDQAFVGRDLPVRRRRGRPAEACFRFQLWILIKACDCVRAKIELKKVQTKPLFRISNKNMFTIRLHQSLHQLKKKNQNGLHH